MSISENFGIHIFSGFSAVLKCGKIHVRIILGHPIVPGTAAYYIHLPDAHIRHSTQYFHRRHHYHHHNHRHQHSIGNIQHPNQGDVCPEMAHAAPVGGWQRPALSLSLPSPPSSLSFFSLSFSLKPHIFLLFCRHLSPQRGSREPRTRTDKC